LALAVELSGIVIVYVFALSCCSSLVPLVTIHVHAFDQTPAGEKSETLEDLFRTLTQLEPKLINMISQIDDEGVMAMCLIVNDDLHKTFERYRAIKKGRKPLKFVPGESTQQTLLNPSHIYTASTTEENKQD